MSWLTSVPAMPCRQTWHQAVADRGRARARAPGPPRTPGTPGRGSAASRSISENAAERVQQDAADREAEAPGDHRVAQLVDEHRDVEQDHERGGDHDTWCRARAGSRESSLA